MTEAHLTVLEGVFYAEEDTLRVADAKLGAVSVDEVLEESTGNLVVIAVHHKPSDPPDKDRWGGGCCFHEPAGECPAGHHERPGWLYTFHEAGTLVRHDGKWFVQKEGKLIEMHLSFLIGHHSQIVVSAIPTKEELKEMFGDLPKESEDQPDLEDLTSRIHSLRDLLMQVNKMKDKL